MDEYIEAVDELIAAAEELIAHYDAWCVQQPQVMTQAPMERVKAALATLDPDRWIPHAYSRRERACPSCGCIRGYHSDTCSASDEMGG